MFVVSLMEDLLRCHTPVIINGLLTNANSADVLRHLLEVGLYESQALGAAHPGHAAVARWEEVSQRLEALVE